MLRSDLFTVAAMPPALAVDGRLPLHVAPAEGEALASWLTSLAALHGLSPLALGRLAFGVDARKDPEWWRHLTPDVLVAIGAKTGLDAGRVADMTFTGWASARDDEAPHRFTDQRWSPSPPTHARGRRVDVCPLCMAGDARAYLRLLWMNGWVGVCPDHHVALTGQCPTCHCLLRVASLKAATPIDMGVCRKCGAKLAGAEADPAHGMALRLQNALVAGKRSGDTVLPGIGRLDWSTTMALADVLLGMVWIDVPGEPHRRLFDRIADDIELGEDERRWLLWGSNYGGLLILAWLLDDLDRHLPAAIGIVRSPWRDRLIARTPDLAADVVDRLREILAPAMTPMPQGRRSWRAWIDTLPESGDDLRVRALNQRYKLRRRRLFALAAVRDGASVVTAAQDVGMMPRTVYRLLLRGAQEGLEAALERPRRRSILSGSQAEALGCWIAAERRRQNHKAVIAGAWTMFGVTLSSQAAFNLLRVHRKPKPGRRQRFWKPKSQRRRRVAGSSHDPVSARGS